MRQDKLYTSQLSLQQGLQDHSANIERRAKEMVAVHRKADIEAMYPGIKEEDIFDRANEVYPNDHKQYMNGIAPYMKTRIDDFKQLTEKSVIIKSSDKFPTKPKYIPDPKIEEIYSKTVHRFFGALIGFDPTTNKVQSGQELIKNAEKFNNMNYEYSMQKNSASVAGIRKAYNLFKTGKEFAAYDLETLGGTNQYGHKQLDAITEFAFKVYDKSNPGVAKSTIENVIGFSEEQYKMLENEIGSIESFGIQTDRQRVIADRLIKYGHNDTVIENLSPGQHKVTGFVGDLTPTESNSTSLMRRGLQRMRDVGIEQEGSRLSSGLMLWQEQFAQFVNQMNNGKMSIIGFNDIQADQPWLNQMLPNMVASMNASQKNQFMAMAGYHPDAIPNIMFKASHHLDAMTMARAAASTTGKTKKYVDEKALGLLDASSTSLQQESLGRLYFNDIFKASGTAAHTAGFDVDILSRLAAQKLTDGLSPLDMMMADIEAGASKIKGSLRHGGVDLLFSGASQSYYNGGADPLNFVHDAMEDAFKTFNGYVINKETGEASKELYGQYGIKRNRFYTLDWAGQFDMTDEWVKEIGAVHQDLAQGRLFAAKISPVVDESVAGAHQGMKSPTFIMADSKDRLEGILSSFMKVGEKNKAGKWQQLSHPEARKEVIDALSMVSIKNGKIQHEGYRGLDGAINHATKMDMNEQAARMIREDSYQKAIRFDQLYNRLEQAIAVDGQPVAQAQVKSALTQIMNNHSLTLSSKVATGEAISMSFADVQSILGFTNQKDGKSRVLTETADKYTTAFDYLSSQRAVSKAIIDHIQSTGEGSKESAQFRYEQILNQLKAQAAKTMAGSPEEMKRMISGSEESKMFAKDANFFNFDMTGFYKDRDTNDLGFKFEPETSDNILRVNLGPNKEYSLVDELLRRSTNLNTTSREQRNLHGLNILKRFVGHVRDQDENKDLFKGLVRNMNDFESADALAETIQRELIEYRKTPNGSVAGYMTDVNIHNVMQENKVLKMLSDNISTYLPEIGKIDSSLPKLKMLKGMSQNEELVKSEAETIVDKILMQDLKVGNKVVSAGEYAKHYGFNDVQSSMFERVHRLTRSAYIEGITRFTKGLLKTDAALAYDTEQQVLAVMLNGQSISLNNLPRISATDGVMYAQVGSNRMAIHAVSNLTGAINNNGVFNPSASKVESTLAVALKNTFNPIVAMEKGAEKGDVLQRVKSWTANFAQNMREGSSVNNLDMLDAFSTLTHDYSQIADVLPYMAKQGLLNGIEFRDKGLMDIARNPNLSYKTMNATQRETIQKNIPLLLRAAYGVPQGSTNVRNDGDFIAINTGFTNKETGVSEFRGTVGGNSLKFGYQLDNSGRPVINQVTRAVSYRRADWEDGIRSNAGRNIEIGSVFGNGADQIAGRTITGLQPGRNQAEQQLRVGKVNMAQIEFQNMIQKSYLSKKALNGSLDAKDTTVFELMKSINLTEQERVMDTRIMDSFFNRVDEQKINARKELALSMDVNQQTLEQVNAMTGVRPVMQIGPNGQITFKYQKGRNVTRMDPVLRTAGFGDIDEVYGSKFRVGRFNFGYFTKAGGMLASEDDVKSVLQGAKTEADALRILDQTYDSAFYVDNMEQLGYKKMAVGYAEKGMTYAPYVGMGRIDDKVANYLRATGNENMIGMTLQGKYLKEITDDAMFVPGQGFESAKDLRRAIRKERHAVFDKIRDIMKRNGLNQDFSVIANDNMVGHGNAMLGVEEAVSSMVQIEKSRGKAIGDKEAIRTVFNRLQANGAFQIEGIRIDPLTGKITAPNNWIGGQDHIDIGKILKTAEEHYPEMVWEDADGKHIGQAIKGPGGSYTTTVISQAQDFQGMTSSGAGAMIDEKLRLKSILDDRTQQGTAEYAAAKAKFQELSVVERALSRGKKITDREVQLLNLQRFDQGYVDTIQKAFTSGDSFDQAGFEGLVGHVLKRNEDGSLVQQDGRYLLDDTVRGRSVLSEYTGDLTRRFLYDKEKGDKLFNQEFIDSNPYYSDSIRAEMSTMAKSWKDKYEISTQRAEQVYSTIKAGHAVSWNNREVTELSHMENLGFVKTDLDKVASSIGHDADYILRNENNVFNRNLMIDLGEHAGESPSERYLALPFTPRRPAGDDDLVKFEFQKKINSLRNRQDAIEEARQSGNPEDLNRAIARYREAITDTRDSVRRELFGKEALDRIGSYRSDSSINGKSSFATLVDPSSGRYEKAFGKDMAEEMQVLADKHGISALNSKSLSDAQFMGSSLLDHYQRGVSIDARFASEESFERLGYFSQDYMNSVGVTSKDEMKNLLATTGVMVDSTRYPTIKEGSTKPTMMYLDNYLSGNRIKLTAAGALAAVADNDGDLIASSIIRDPKTNADSLQRAMSGASSTALDDTFWKNLQGYMVYRGAGVNQYWEDQVYDTMRKDMERSVQNGDLMTVTGSRRIDDKIYAEFMDSPSQDAIRTNSERYSHLMKMVEQKHGNIASNRDDMLKQVDTTIASMATEEQERYKKAFIFEDAFSRSEIGQMAKVRKLTIGEANIPLFRLRMASEIGISGLAAGDETRRNLLQSTAEIIEQEVISSKKGNVRDYVTKTEEFKNALNGLMYGNESKRQTAGEDMRAWLNRNAKSEMIEAAKKLKITNPDYDILPADGDPDKIARAAIDTFVDTVGSLNTQQVKQARFFDSMSSEFVRMGDAMGSIPNRGGFRDTFFNLLNDSGLSSQSALLDPDASRGSYKAISGAGAFLSDGHRWLEEEGSTAQNVKNMVRGMSEAVGEFAKNMDGKTLAIGALGIAGAYLMAGFVGGNPSEPAETQAAQMQNYSEVPSLQDPGMAASQPTMNGYVVNINARTNQGKQHAMDALQQAVSRSTSTNVNIAMNINEDTGNIDDRYVDRLLAGALN